MSNAKLPSGWIESIFTEHLQIQGGQQPPKSEFIFEEKEGYIRLLQIRDFGAKPVLNYIPISKKNKLCEKEDILIARYGASLGRICTGMSGAYNVALAKVITPAYVDKKYLEYFLNSTYFQYPLALLSRSAQNGFNKDDLERFPLIIAPLAEQKEIAKLLEQHLAQVEQIKAHLAAIPKLLTTFRQSVLSDAVSGKLTENWRNNNNPTNSFHDSKCLKSFRAEALVELPENWLWLPFSSIADIASNLTDPKLTPKAIHLAPNHIEKSTGRVIEISTIEKDNVKSAKHRFSKGQIVYSKIRPYLCKVVIADFDGLCSADMYPINSKINSKYLFLWMLSPKFTHWASNAESRVVLPKINQKDLNKIPTPTPPLEEQNEIVSRVEELFAFADNIERQVQSTTEHINLLTQSILAKAFRGELTADWRKQNTELISGDNSAEALLARIQAQMKSSKAKTKAMS